MATRPVTTRPVTTRPVSTRPVSAPRRSFARVMALAGRDIKMYFQDAQMLFFSVALPLVLVFLMVASFGGQTSFNVKAYVVNLDRGEKGAEFVERLSAISELTVEVLGQADAEKRLADSSITSYIAVDPAFSDQVAAGESPSLLVRQRGTGGTEGQIAVSYASAVARELAGESRVVRQVGGILATLGKPVPASEARAKVLSLFEETKADPPVGVVEEVVGSRPEPVAIYLPGLVTMFTLFAVSLSSMSLVEDRKRGMLERLMTTRLSRGELLSGTGIGTLVRGLVQIVVLFGLSWAFFRLFTPGSFVAVLVFGAIAVASVSGVGLVIATFANTPEQANWVGVFFTMLMTVVGGSFFDTTAAKGILGYLTRLTYNFWANDGFRRIILKSEPLSSPAILKDIAVLAGIGVVSWVIALAFFRLRGDDK